MKAPVCPTCKRPIPARIPDAKVKARPVPVKEYALERKFGVRRVNGGFV